MSERSLSEKVLSDSLFSAVRILVTMLRALMVVPLITNLLGASDYGIWASVLALVGLISSTGELHLHGSLVRYGSSSDNYEQTYSDILSLSMFMGIILCTLALLGGLLLDPAMLFNGELENPVALVVASSLLIFMTIIMNINKNFPRSKGMVKSYDLIKMAREALEATVLFLIFFGGGSVIAGIFGLVGVLAFMNVCIMSFVFYRYKVPLPDPSNFEKYIRYGIPIVPKEVSSSLLRNADKYIILFLISPTAVGIYAVAHTICKTLVKFSSVLNPTLYPSVTSAWDQGDKEEVSLLYKQIFRYYTIFAIPAFFGIVYLAYPIMAIFSTPDMAEQGAFLIPILAFGFLLRGYDNSVGYILYAAEKTTKIARAVIVAAFINTFLNIALVYVYGIAGAAVATTISQATVFYLLFRYSSKEIQLRFPTLSIIRCGASSLIMFVVIYNLNLVTSPILKLIVYPLVGAGVYFVVLLFSGEFSDEDLDIISNKLGSGDKIGEWLTR
jgi:O-antigen/teichoic acid export membrane protein